MKSMLKKAAFVLGAALLAAPLSAAEDRPSVSKSDTVKVKTTVEAIDHTARTVTLKDRDGNLVTVQAGPDVQGFDDLKVGDKVTFRYTEGVVLQVHPAGQAGTHVTNPSGGDPSGAPYDSPSGSAPGGDESAAAAGSPTESGPGDEPVSLVGEQVTSVVTVKDVDPKGHWITFETEDGHTVSTHVDDRDLVKNLHAGDQIEMTYTNAVLVSCEPED
jgi:hypothetical protein